MAVDGLETTFALRSSGDTILDAALQQGIDPPYSCAGGACGTCRAKVLLGEAVMDQNHVLDADELARGYVLTCQAHPVSEEVRIDYDASSVAPPDRQRTTAPIRAVAQPISTVGWSM